MYSPRSIICVSAVVLNATCAVWFVCLARKVNASYESMLMGFPSLEKVMLKVSFCCRDCCARRLCCSPPGGVMLLGSIVVVGLDHPVGALVVGDRAWRFSMSPYVSVCPAFVRRTVLGPICMFWNCVVVRVRLLYVAFAGLLFVLCSCRVIVSVCGGICTSFWFCVCVRVVMLFWFWSYIVSSAFGESVVFMRSVSAYVVGCGRVYVMFAGLVVCSSVLFSFCVCIMLF